MRITGCPASPNRLRSGMGGSSPLRIGQTNTRSVPYTSTLPGASAMTGTMPLPSLPVLSATSCSAQSPNPEILCGRKKVSLFLPARLRTPRAVPSLAPSLAPKSETSGCLQESAMAMARSRSRAASMPRSAPGTRPKTESAEKRPPMVGSPANTFLNAHRRAVSFRGLPGSVMATKCSPASSRPRTAAVRP
ncbi:MAG: hypothetical protein BWX71_01343 [Deltaproteobacteria bacterium ADurb.Bin072]|nr:MAG: hypothetical protein BWX71_01343 [Deltaproteobacteria bacterium ADurb.Bin072]